LPVLLCYLQGLSSEEAAQRLGCAKGTVFSRLSQARDLLRRRLVRRGVDVSAVALAAVLAESAALRAMPPLALREITIRTSLLFAAGTAGQSLPAPLAALVEGVVRSMFLSKVKFALIVVLAFGLVGSGLGFLAHQTNADPPSPQSPSAKQDKLRVDVPAPANAKVEAPAPANRKRPDPRDSIEHSPHTWQAMLNRQVDYPGLEDPRATLTDVLDQLSKRYNLAFSVNVNAFRALVPEIDPTRYKIAMRPVPEMHASVKTVLQTILARLPAKTGPMLLFRKDYIEITTETAVRAELQLPANRPLLPLVSSNAQYDLPLGTALRLLRDQSGCNIVVDPRVADKLETEITFEFSNVPIDTAVRLLVSMAGLAMVRLDNVFYVTTAEHAKQLREEQAKINAETPVKVAETPTKPASEKDAEAPKKPASDKIAK
jgi:hypothetical protein